MMYTTPEVIAEAEALDRLVLEGYVGAQAQRWPTGRAAVRATGAGVAAFDATGRDSRLAGLIDAAPGWSGEIEAMLRWHAARRAASPHPERHSQCRMVLAPDASPALPQWLAGRGCRYRCHTPVLGCALAEVRLLDGSTDVRVIEADQALREQTAELIARGYLDGQDPSALDVRAALTWFDAPGATHFVAVRGGELAGGAALVHHGECVLLGQMAVLPRHRRHGVQRALVRRRLEHARQLGARRAYLTTAPRGPSIRNAQRAGFAMLYSRISFER